MTFNDLADYILEMSPSQRAAEAHIRVMQVTLDSGAPSVTCSSAKVQSSNVIGIDRGIPFIMI